MNRISTEPVISEPGSRESNLGSTLPHWTVLGVELLCSREIDLVEKLVHGLVVGLPIEQIPIAERTEAVARVLFHGDGVPAHRGYSSRLFTVPDVSGCVMALTLGGYKSGPQLPARLYARG